MILSRCPLKIFVLALSGIVIVPTIHRSAAAAAAIQSPKHLRCAGLENPLGIDRARPHLSWVLPWRAIGSRQTAYQVVMATSARHLQPGAGATWDSGKVTSGRSIEVPYAGPPLSSGERCYWRVRAWNQDNRCSGWSKAAFWSMGLLKPTDWRARWIGWKGRPSDGFFGARWIVSPAPKPSIAVSADRVCFRSVLRVERGGSVKSAALRLAADGPVTLFVNGRTAFSRTASENWKRSHNINLIHFIRAGSNVFDILVQHCGYHDGYGDPTLGVLARISVRMRDGKRLIDRTGPRWQVAENPRPGFQSAAIKKADGWRPATAIGRFALGDWRDWPSLLPATLPAIYLRHEFVLKSPAAHATVYFSGLGASELFINGHRIGRSFLSPALSNYRKRVFYRTYDVGKYLRPGKNVIGAVLGNGRFWSPRLAPPYVNFGYPCLRLQMNVLELDGSHKLVLSGRGWRMTDHGPIRANNEYDGEVYNALMRMRGWDRPGFQESRWNVADLVDGPSGAMRAQMINPIRVTQVVRPVAMRPLGHDRYIFDMGQNMVGWCKLRVAGPAGGQVSLRYAEGLQPDGHLFVANLRSAQQTDWYTLGGGGVQYYHPRFTYHGFRYVEVSGYPGGISRSDIEGQEVHDVVSPTGSFTCSNGLVNKIYHSIAWTVKNNYRSIPTDCPQRDERMGWMGDRSQESQGETTLFNVRNLYSKWEGDIRDSLNKEKMLPMLAPTFWSFYSNGVDWQSTFLNVPWMLYLQYGDLRPIRRNYPTMKLWIDHMLPSLKHDLMFNNGLGDWCAPPRDRHRIHSRNPFVKPKGVLLSTPTFYHDLVLMSRFAKLLGRKRESQKYQTLASRVKQAFNKKFLNTATWKYGAGTEASSILALGCGIAPAQDRRAIDAQLAHTIRSIGAGHVWAGAVGVQWLMRALSDYGHARLAWRIAGQTSYPSWGYMLKHGATTIWELWDGNTANPAMNSQDHVMLVGDLVIWLYQDIAGIAPDPAEPGYRHILMDPHPLAGLRFVNCSLRSPYGLIQSDWRLRGNSFAWHVRVPCNATATLDVPAISAMQVRINGRPLSRSPGVEFLRQAGSLAVFRVESGSFNISSIVSKR